eukprot:Gb_04982 [translate_table: standard]
MSAPPPPAGGGHGYYFSQWSVAGGKVALARGCRRGKSRRQRKGDEEGTLKKGREGEVRTRGINLPQVRTGMSAPPLGVRACLFFIADAPLPSTGPLFLRQARMALSAEEGARGRRGARRRGRGRSGKAAPAEGGGKPPTGGGKPPVGLTVAGGVGRVADGGRAAGKVQGRGGPHPWH